MAKPTLTVIAGCNGSGKSSFSLRLTSFDTPSFDYDKEFMSIYNSEDDSELRERISHNKARQLLESRIERAISEKINFTYETNFNSTPLHWPEEFKNADFGLRLVYFCLDSIKEAKRRVQIRVENGGHFVPDWEVEKRYQEGFENLNLYWDFFNEIFLFDTSRFKEEPKHILTAVNQKKQIEDIVPEYLFELIPSILKS